jgi:hypothetical protein
MMIALYRYSITPPPHTPLSAERKKRKGDNKEQRRIA